MNSRSKLFSVLCWSGVGLTAVAFAAFAYTAEQDRRAHAIRPADGCLAFADPPAVTVFLNDKTDRLQGGQPRRWRAELDEEVARLPPGSLLLIGSIGPAAPTEMTFTRLCVPIPGRGTHASQLQKRFNDSLKAVGTDLEQSPTTPASAISATIAAAAADVAFHAKTTGPRRLVVNSDLLENDEASVYRPGRFAVPALSSGALSHTTLRFNVLRNKTDTTRQTRALIEAWTSWAHDAGAASVEVDAPQLGLHPPAPPQGVSS